MQDRPTYDELLAAIEHFLDTEIAPSVPGARGFHARVSANAIRTIRRELAAEDQHLAAEWEGLDALLGPGDVPPAGRDSFRSAIRERNEALCATIRQGLDHDRLAQVFAHVRATVRNKISVSNPNLLDRGS